MTSGRKARLSTAQPMGELLIYNWISPISQSSIYRVSQFPNFGRLEGVEKMADWEIGGSEERG